MILKKVWEIYLMKGCSDEMQMSLSDFEFAVRLPRKKNKLEYESDLEQVIKTALLWIEEDLSFRMAVLLLKSIHRLCLPMAMYRKRRVMPLSVKNTSSIWFPWKGLKESTRWLLNLCGKIVSRRWGIVSLSAIYTMEISLRSSCGSCG